MISLSVIAAVIIALSGVCIMYLNDSYVADEKAIQAFSHMENISVDILPDETIVYMPENPSAGFIFYPGGKVEYKSYEPLMKECASRGIACFLVKAPFNLAVFRIDGATGIQEKYTDINKWYIGGHSLGGSMASAYLAEAEEKYDGLILLASYSSEDISQMDIDVVSIVGSEDKVLNKENYESCKVNLPSSYEEEVIKGGCHSYFGVYGMQEGDGTPDITNEEQIYLTADIIKEFFKK